MTLLYSSLFIIIGIAISFYFFRRYKSDLPLNEKLLEFAADLFSGANILGPLLIAVGLVGIWSELRR